MAPSSQDTSVPVPSSSVLVPGARERSLLDLSPAQLEKLIDELDAELGGLSERARFFFGGVGALQLAMGTAMLLRSSETVGWLVLTTGIAFLGNFCIAGIRRVMARRHLEGTLRPPDARRLFDSVTKARRAIAAPRARTEAARLLTVRRQRLQTEVKAQLGRH